MHHPVLLASVWCKMDIFKWAFCATMVLHTRYVLTIFEGFLIRYCIHFYVKGYPNYHKSYSIVPKKFTLLYKFRSWKFLISDDFNVPWQDTLHAVPHLKGPISGQDKSSWQNLYTARHSPKCSAKPITVTPIWKWEFENKEHPIRGLFWKISFQISVLT